MPSDIKECPYCAENIKLAAIKCRFCLSDLLDPVAGPGDRSEAARSDLYPGVTARQWWFYLLASTPKTRDELRASGKGIQRMTAETALAALVGRGLLTVTGDGDAATYQRAAELNADQRSHVAGLLAERGIAAPWGSLSGATHPRPDSSAHVPKAAEAVSEPTHSLVPLRKWRGQLARITSATVQAYCKRCQATWRLGSSTTTAIADAQGLANRLIRGGTRAEQAGATFTVGASGRRIAAGNEADRQTRDLNAVLRLAACPTCGQIDRVYLAR